jgi:putative ABC transport system ATP-binding protein
MSTEPRAARPAHDTGGVVRSRVDTAIRAHALTRWYEAPAGGRVEALAPRTLDVGRGEAVALVGRSGCGKSTLLNILGLLEPPSAGALAMLGVDVLALSASGRARFRRTTLGFVFQSFCLLKDRTVHANVELPLVYAGLAPAQRRQRVGRWLEQVGLEGLGGRLPSELSGGQQQRAALARAMVGAPAIVLADEPTGSLDGPTGTRVVDVLLESCARGGASCVIATHDPVLAARCDRVERLDLHAEQRLTDDHAPR